MIGKFGKVLEVFRRDGLYTFGYMAMESLRNRRSGQAQYKKWQKIHERKKVDRIPAGDVSFTTLILGDAGAACSASVTTQKYPAGEIVEVPSDAPLKDVLEKTSGDYVAFVKGTDSLAAHALQCMAGKIKDPCYEDCRLFYSDEDENNEKGERSNPFFKPDYSPDTLRSFFYMGGLLVMRRDLLAEIECRIRTDVRHGGYLPALAASMFLKEEEVCHIPEVLYHRAGQAVRQNREELAKAKESVLSQSGIQVRIEEVPDAFGEHILYDVGREPLVSIIIPSKDNPSMLRQCLESIFLRTAYRNYEIVIVDNGSSTENKRQYEALCGEQRVPCQYHYEPMEFNFANMCNIGADAANGEYLLFLNDDIEVLPYEGTDWLERLTGQAMQPHTGAVGARLLYPDSRRIQHIGVVNYAKGAAHLYAGRKDDEVLPGGRNRFDYNVSMVTGACMMIDREKFEAAGKFCEDLSVTYNDVELCIRLLKAGYYQIVRNDVVLYHHESVSRGTDSGDRKRFFRHMQERQEVYRRHPDYLLKDRYYSQNLTVKSMNGAIRTQAGPYNEPVLHGDCLKHAVQTENLRCRVTVCVDRGTVRVQGFAFLEKGGFHNSSSVFVVLKGQKDTVCLPGWKVYDPVLAQSVNVDANLNFARFYAQCERMELQEERYQVGVLLSAKPFGKKYFRMTDTFLKIMEFL